MNKNNLKINTKTTGFASPAESYVDSRLDLNDLVIYDINSTFYFKYNGNDTLNVKKGNILVIDKSIKPNIDDLIVIILNRSFKISKYDGTQNVWGKITWILNKL